MRYIKVKFRLSGGPCADDYDSYGWETIWNKKTQTIEGEVFQAGTVNQLDTVRVRRDGKCLILGTEYNIKKIKAMVEKGQMTLAPGEKLESSAEIGFKKAEEAWPEPAKAADAVDEPEELEAPDIQEPISVETVKRRGRPRKEDIKPDVE